MLHGFVKLLHRFVKVESKYSMPWVRCAVIIIAIIIINIIVSFPMSFVCLLASMCSLVYLHLLCLCTSVKHWSNL